MRRTPALIIGGGPAGSAAAIMLARGGLTPQVVERSEMAHDVVCGGFLGWDALAALERLGIDAFALGARPISRLRLVNGRTQVEVRLPRRAAGLSRRVLDEALLVASAASGASVMRGRMVREADPTTCTVRMDGGEKIRSDALFLASGKHEIRGVGRPPIWTGRGAVGFRAAISASSTSEPLNGVIELHLFNGGYAGLLLQEDGRLNLCVSVAKDRFPKAASAAALMADLVSEAPLLCARMTDLEEPSWQAIAGVPYGWRTAEASCGVFRLGDQAAVISSLAGDGVAIALTSGIEAALAFLHSGPIGSSAYQADFARRCRSPLKIADFLRWSVEKRTTRPILMRAASIRGLAPLAARLTRIA